MALSVETLFPSPKETMCDKHLWEARDFSRVRLHYSDLSMDAVIRHLARFVSCLWQIHVFGEGNTRTTAVFF